MLLEAHFRKKLAFFTLQVDIETGDGVFALLGASGCGKSMTLKCIAGIERPDEGRIVLDGRVLFDAEKRIDLPPQKRRVGYMFQDYALFPNMTVRENVMAGVPRGGKSVRGGLFGKRRQADLPADRAQAVLPSESAQSVRPSERTHTPAEDIQAQTDDLLATFQIEEIAELKPAKLSGGQKQRVAMARILMQRPDVILLDEPFAALDSYLKWQLEQEMAATLKQIGKPVIFVSHSRDEVYHLADRVCVLSGGRTGEAAETKAFFADPGRARRRSCPAARTSRRRSAWMRIHWTCPRGASGSGCGARCRRASTASGSGRTRLRWETAKERCRMRSRTVAGQRRQRRAAEDRRSLWNLMIIICQSWLPPFWRIPSSGPYPSARRRAATGSNGRPQRPVIPLS